MLRFDLKLGKLFFLSKKERQFEGVKSSLLFGSFE